MFELNPDVLGAQSCYKTLLSAISRPGTINRIKFERLYKERACQVPWGLLAACECLLDEQVTIGGLKENGERWATEISSHMKVPFRDPGQADFVLADRIPTAHEMATMPHGSLLTPEKGATLFFYVGEGIQGEAGSLEFQGPGVAGSLKLRVSRTVLDWAFARQGICFEYPMGIDTFLFDGEGEVLGVPRTCSLKVCDCRRD